MLIGISPGSFLQIFCDFDFLITFLTPPAPSTCGGGAHALAHDQVKKL